MIPGTSETHTEGFPYEVFRHRETKYFQRKIVILLCIKFSIPQIFWNFEAMPAKFFGTVRPKIFDWKSWYSLLPPPPLIHNFFSIPDFSDTQIRKVPLRNFSALRQKKIDTKSWDKSLKHKIFRYPKLVTHWRVPLRNFSALWDRHFLTENRDTPSSPPPSYP